MSVILQFPVQPTLPRILFEIMEKEFDLEPLAISPVSILFNQFSSETPEWF
jgi:hypothetical protein